LARSPSDSAACRGTAENTTVANNRAGTKLLFIVVLSSL
jgi:hypothetical protein